ncbi:hypothetical protein LIER_27043 [Lithospermum erythrorhizon]|uniref:Uncharacterized protein n=1 Tax=Lithospermum erythrorhizon TaxID=34254 RepID=A0AAV3RDZ6_LITER
MANAKIKSQYLFCKFFIIVIILLIIPLFQSQTTEFSTISSFFTKLWEPLQLLFVGLATCYGLFCKRSSTKLEIENFNVNGEKDLCFYGGLDISSFFEDGFQNSCGYDEKNMILKSEERFKLSEGNGVRCLDFGNRGVKKDGVIQNSWNFRGESIGVVENGDCVVDERVSQRGCKKLNLPVRSEEGCGLDEGNGVRYLSFGNVGMKKDDVIEEKVTEGWNSLYFRGESMLVVSGDGVVDEWGRSVSKREYKPLNLPVRSLRSSIVVDDKYQENGITEGDYSAEGPLKIRGVRPINLEKKFEEVSSRAPVSCLTRSCMMEMKEGTRRRRESSRLRPHSAGEFDTDLKSSGMGGSVPRVASEESFMISNSMHSSFDSSLDMTLQRSNKEIFEETNQKEDNFNGEKRGSSSVYLEAKPTKVSRVLSRGKSVRTIRSSKIVPYEIRGGNAGESNAGEVYGEIQDSSILNLAGHESPEVEVKSNIDNHFPEPVDELPESQSDDKQDCFESSSITSRDNSESESQSYPSSSEEVARSDIEGSEVDRKAGEFIAKFREQIRLQKLASAKRPSNTDIS